MKLLSEGGFCVTKSWITSVNSSWVEGKSWVGLRSRPATRRAFTGTHSLIHLSSRPYKPTNHAVVSSIFRSAGIPFTLYVYSQDSVTRALEAEVILGIRNPRAVFVPVTEVVRRATACCYNRNSEVLKDGVPRYRNHRAVAQLSWCLKAGLWSSVMELILWIFWGNQTKHKFIGFRSHTNQKNESPLARVCDFIRFEEMVYTLDIMVLIFSFAVLVELPKRGHVSRRLPFLCQPCSGLPYTFLLFKNVVHRTTKRLKYF